MGFTPQQIDQMSLWQFEAACVGYSAQFGDQGGMTEREADELFDWLISKDDVAMAHTLH